MTNMERRIGIRGVYSVLWLMTESLSISIDISINDTKEYNNETDISDNELLKMNPLSIVIAHSIMIKMTIKIHFTPVFYARS